MIIKTYDDINFDIRDDVELTDEVAALALLTRAIAIALDMGMMTQEEVDWVVARVAKATARRGRQR